MAIQTITDIKDLKYPNGDTRYDVCSNNYFVVIRGGQPHDWDQLALHHLTKDPNGHDYWWCRMGSHQSYTRVRPFAEALEWGIEQFGMVYATKGDADMIHLLQMVADNNLRLKIQDVPHWNYGREPKKQRA